MSSFVFDWCVVGVSGVDTGRDVDSASVLFEELDEG